MIKLGNYLLTSEYIHIVSIILMFGGLILVFIFPLLGENTFIEEKQLKNTPLLSRDIDLETFRQNYKEYLTSLNETSKMPNKILQFCIDILLNKENKPYNYIYTKEIMSPRGDKLKFIQINLIYDPNLKEKESMLRGNIVFYSILKFYSDQNNIPWLSTDIQFNYITKELFYLHPKECYELLTNAKNNKKVSYGQKISGILNIDLTEFDVENFKTFKFRFHGKNSEQVDMDYYKMIYDNFISTFVINTKITTQDEILSQGTTELIELFLKIPSLLLKIFIDSELYINYFLFAINNILSNFFMINNYINTNHLLVTNNHTSMLMKIITKNTTKNYINITLLNTIKNTTFILKKNKTNIPKIDYTIIYRYRFIIGAFELIIKGISREEIDLFRGQYFYLLLDPQKFVGYYYLFILICLSLRVLDELISYINNYQNNNDPENVGNKQKKIQTGKITGGLFILFLLSLILFLHIEKIIKISKMDNILTYYLIIIFIMLAQMATLISFNLNKNEEIFLNELLMFLMTLNCWNFIFLNIGIGLVTSIIILPMELLFIHLKSIKYNLYKITFLLLIIVLILKAKVLLSSMIKNYLVSSNNVYVIISVIIFFISLRMEFFLIIIYNNIKRGKPWNSEE